MIGRVFPGEAVTYVARHFFDVDFVKRYIDLLALHKQNVFHLHLTEDQGWRLQIDRYPKLTAVGAWRDDSDGARYGGSYSRAEALDVVGFRDRVAWPRAGGADRLPTSGLHRRPLRSHAGVGVFDDVFCVGNDEAIGFLEVVFDEVLDIFPSPFIHVGGDECPKVRWKECPRCQARMQQEGMADEDALQSWTIRHFDRYLADRGRRLVGWDEILEGGLAPGATVMSWRGVAGGLAASRAGHDVVMRPTSTWTTSTTRAPTNRVGSASAPWRTVTAPTRRFREMTADEASHVLGVQANVWSEGFDTPAAFLTWREGSM